MSADGLEHALEVLTLGLDQDVVLTIARGTHTGMKAAITVQPDIRAPLKKGDRLGSLVIRSGDTVVVERPLVAMNDVEEANIFVRCWHWLKMFFSGLFG